MATTKTYTLKKAMVAAMHQTLGVVKKASTEVVKTIEGLKPESLRVQHYAWMREDDEYKAEIESIDLDVFDFGKSALFEKILEGDTACIIYLMKTKGAKHGYAEQKQIDIQSQGEKIGISTIQWVDGKDS